MLIRNIHWNSLLQNPHAVGGRPAGQGGKGKAWCRRAGAYARTDEERGAGLGEVVEAVAAQDVAEDEGEHEHGDLQQNPHAGHLLLLPGRGERRRLRQAAARRRRSRGQAQLQRHLPRRGGAGTPLLVSLGRGPVKGLGGAEEVLERRPGSREESEVARGWFGSGKKGATGDGTECGGVQAVVGPRFLDAEDAYNAGASC